jgi:hypothetical protein
VCLLPSPLVGCCQMGDEVGGIRPRVAIVYLIFLRQGLELAM